MIRVVKDILVPSYLAKKGAVENLKNQKLYDAEPSKCISGKQSLDIFTAIYGHKSVKYSLRKTQYNKCCFCEKSQRDENGAVEHFRPKGGYKIARKSKLVKPGYYWCGYSWSNLYFVCNACNGAASKGNLFPLVDEAKRAISHHQKIGAEKPLLLDPGGTKDPRHHIHFDGPLTIGKTVFGTNTISICRLNRPELIEFRKELIENIQARIEILNNKRSRKDSVTRAIKYLKSVQLPQSPFSATAEDYIKKSKVVLA